MENERSDREVEHWMRCPDCGEKFDMRDLTAVFDHQHWIEEKPLVNFSHVTMIGEPKEVYLKVRGKMVTFRLVKKHK